MTSRAQDTASLVSPPVSIQSLSSAFSEVESTASLESASSTRTQGADPDFTVPGIKRVHPEFAFADGNVEVETPDLLFWIHEYQLNRFSKIASLIQEARSSETTSNSDHRIRIKCDGRTEDFYNTFRVIYASTVFGPPPDYDSATLISTLRITTIYDCPELRSFAISNLEKKGLGAIVRVQLSDEFSLPSWEMSAFAELCRQPEAISFQDAEILGTKRFVEIARIREADLRRRFFDICDNKSVMPDFLGPDGRVNENALKRDGDFASENQSLPPCSCRRVELVNLLLLKQLQPAGPCEIHAIAPRILDECRNALKQRDDFLNRLSSLKQAMISQQQATPDGAKIVSVEDELEKALGVRRVN